ncbi:cytochrome b/b6 domain-containing protein [Rhizobium straminoryzae]|uniref:Cytochrome b/b6 domain-containing protein n=1 Tax=Rhizobium straminoryzae TaxID=1387186 RepID=A0A549T277_9HYPH|nr:cytochrome b/b6 domain-containing protein [Rhizobium straminoryzae]TRL35970.1 cytochrome b/b6 domain-containing protein [Rhizobium straminoryzae]
MQRENRWSGRTAHPGVIRVTHWINVFAMVCMVMSGMGIYNAHPILPFRFPEAVTLGGWLGGSTVWHFAVMWLLIGNGLAYLLFGSASGYLRARLLKVGPRDVLRDLRQALAFRLQHQSGDYNAIQKLMYLGALLLGVLMVASGLALWKPVQFHWLTTLFGGFATTRVVHFAGMAGLLGFVFIHVAMVAIVPRTLLSMSVGTSIFDKKKEPGRDGQA